MIYGLTLIPTNKAERVAVNAPDRKNLPHRYTIVHTQLEITNDSLEEFLTSISKYP